MIIIAAIVALAIVAAATKRNKVAFHLRAGLRQ
jgi:hypothetical protein